MVAFIFFIKMIGVLYNIRSIFNTASIFRSSDALCLEKLYLVGYTPEPVNKFGREVEKFKKVSLGAEKTVPWEKKKDIIKLIKKLKKEGYKILSLEITDKAIPYFEYCPNNDKIALIVGNEIDGLPKKVLDNSDKVLYIPMKGKKESLNVAIAFSIVAFHLKYRKTKRL